MSRIHKSSTFADIPTYDKEYWWAKTPQERLAAALKLIRRAKAIYYANPNNPPLGNGGHVLKSDKPRSADAVQRGRR
jgi:histidinol-phosphate/aromatic aminotransferase/cobyric acid decarboxylase-like protein